jgi:hypothetical protein
MDVHVYQIVYSEQSRRLCDPGFRQLDNLANERPDWREYWPIRNYLKSAKLDEDAYYGFVSPKFRQKTGLSSEETFKFIRAGGARYEVFLFSPFFDQLAYFRNVFEQAEAHVPGLTRLTADFLARAGLDGDLSSMVSCSKNAVFSNYIVARPSFWRAWLDVAESLFRMAEDPDDPLFPRLNGGAPHEGGRLPYKIFIQERIASYVLRRYDVRAIKACPLVHCTADNTLSGRFFLELIMMDSVKFAYVESGHRIYLETFERLREHVQAQLA